MATFVRSAISDFSIANPYYVNATVTFYLADDDGQKTATLATLYEGAVGPNTLTNPQTLDSTGKFIRPVYVGQNVVATASGATIESHDTGLIQVPMVNSYEVYTFDGDGTTDEFSLPNVSVESDNSLLVAIDGVVQEVDADYSFAFSTKTLTFTTAPANATRIVVTDRGLLRDLNQPSGGSVNVQSLAADTEAFFAQTANNLSDLSDVPTALVNLGLDTAALTDAANTFTANQSIIRATSGEFRIYDTAASIDVRWRNTTQGAQIRVIEGNDIRFEIEGGDNVIISNTVATFPMDISAPNLYSLREIVVIPYDVDPGDLPTGFTKDSAGQVTWDTTAFPWLKFVVSEIQSAGGGGGSAEGGSGSAEGAGGGGGAWSSKKIDVGDLASSETITTGAPGDGGAATGSPNNGSDGGTSSFGAHHSATGGAGGGGGTNTEGSNAGSGGSGGSASGGDINIDGRRGNSRRVVSGNAVFANYGGTSPVGGGNFGDGGQGGISGVGGSNTAGNDGLPSYQVLYLFG